MSIVTIPQHNPDVVELPTAFDEPHESIHSGQIDYAGFDNNPALKRASDSLGFGRVEASAINQLRVNPNPEHRAALHDRTVREACDKFDRSLAEKFDGAKAALLVELSSVEAALTTKAGLKSNPIYVDAITSSFFNMNAEKRMATLTELIEQCDGASLATLIAAPLFITGLTAESRDSIKERLFRRVDPKGLALRNQLNVALARLENASLASLPMRAKLRAGTGDGAWRERSKAAAARAAADNLARR